MLHPVYQKKVFSGVPELAVLYQESRKYKIKLTYIRTTLFDYIKSHRVECQRSQVKDKLAQKLQDFGNNGGWYHAKVRELARIVYNNKIPTRENLGEWRSIEFELIFKSNVAENAFVMFVRNNKLHNDITIKNDGSLNGFEPGEVPREIVVTYRKGNESVVEKVCEALKPLARVNSTCGTHVHFDMRHKTESEATTYGKRVARWINALRSILPRSRRENYYCSAAINNVYGGSRYSFVNLHAYRKYGTLEIRGHSGTINAKKILNWIKLCDAIMLSRIRLTERSSLDHNNMVKVFKFDNEMAAYVRQRFSTFNDPIRPQAEEMD